MFKNLLKKNMIVIFGVALLCSVLVAYSFIRSSGKTSSFEQSGYVHVDVNENEDKRVLFSGGQKYKSIVDSKIKFSDSANKERRIASDNFIHYDDDSIAAFKDGVIVNVGDLSAETSTMNHFYISPGMALRNTGSSYTAENSGQEIDFADFLWKISENKYLAISKSITANFSDTDQRDCGTYAEITYLDGKVIQIQTDDNVWQTISNDAKLILNDGSIIDLAMKNIKDQNGNVLLDFSRIIIDPNANIELTPMDAEMESVNENVIPRFVVNNTPGDSGADGTSGIIGLTGVDGLDGNKGKQGEDGLSDDKRGDSDGKQFPVFSVMDWKVTPNSCFGRIYVEDESEVLITNDNSGSGLFSNVYLVDLDTGANIPLPESERPSAYQFADIRNSSDSYFEFTFTGLQTDHSYMLYASAPIQMDDESNPYSRGFVSKTFWTDSSGVYIEDAAVDTNSYQVVAHTNNINSSIGVYLFQYPFEDYDVISTLNLNKIKEDYSSYIGEALWPVNTDDSAAVIAGSKTMPIFTSYLGVDSKGSPVVHSNAIKSNTHYYTMLLFDSNHDGTIDDYSVQILDTLTLKMRPTVAPPSLESNKTIGGFDITPGIVTDEDAAVTNYAIEIYSIDHIDTTGGESSKFVVKTDPLTQKPYEPDKIINLKNNSPTSISLGGLSTADYVSREVLTVFDNEKEYYVYSGFSNSSHLEESVQPMVYFQPFGTLDPEAASPLTTLSPYYDTCVGILHIYPGSNGYMYLVNEGSIIQIDGDNYSYNFLLKSTSDELSVRGDKSVYDGAKFPAYTKPNGEVEIYFLDYATEDKSWMSGLKPNSEYYITVYGDLYTDPSADLTDPANIAKHMTTVGKCTVKTPPLPGVHMAMSTSPSSPNILKDLSMAMATPSQLRSSLNKPLASAQEESYYNRQLETFYGFKVTAYLNDYSEEKKYLPSTDEKIVDGKKYYSRDVGNKYTEVDLKLDENKNKKPVDAWYEYKEAPLKEEDYWFSKTFTNDELWKSGDYQVYMLYDFGSENEQLKSGVQVVGVPDEKGVETYVLSSNGDISLDSTKWKYPYLSYNRETGLPTSTDRTNIITSNDVIGGGLRFKVTPLHKLDSLFSASIERGRNTATADYDYIVSSGGMLFNDNIFDDVLGETLEKAVLGEEGVIKRKGAIGVTLIIEEIFDYTGNSEDSSLNKQKNVKISTKDDHVEFREDGLPTKIYYCKNGDLYTEIDVNNMNPSQLGLFVKENVDGVMTYVKTTDTTIVYGTTYYYLYQGAYYEFDRSELIPSHLGWYESSNHYINYFENTGEKRIYIPFSRSIGDINLELPYNTDPLETEGKIERHTISDDDEYHYYYTAQANFLNSNLLADTITYRIYDSVDFYNTKNHLNNDKEYVNWALLGRDPRITNPTDVFTDTWVIQDVQTIDPSPKGEFVYQQVKGIDGTSGKGLELIHPYAYGWYEKNSSGKYVLTKDVTISGNNKYYINSGANTYTQLNTSAFSPKALKWYEEIIKEATESTPDKNKTYYAKTLVQSLEGGTSVEYNVVDPENISPSSFCWYELNTTLETYTLSNDTVVSPDPDKKYYYYDGSNYKLVSNKDSVAAGSVNPSDLGWSFGDKILTDKEIVESGDRFFVKYLINVHSTDELSSGAYTNYDTYLSPVENNYKEKAKKLATDDLEVVPGRRYYTQYFNEKSQDCYKLIDLTSNEFKTVKSPSAAGWFTDDDAKGLVYSNDKYFDVEKEYFTSTGTSVNSSVSPKAQGWFEKKKVKSDDTLINYSKSYFAEKADGSYTERINPNINPSQLNWYEVAKKDATGAYNKGTNYYSKRGDSYVLVGDPINPSAIGWYEAKRVVSDDSIYSSSTTYYARVLDEDWNETFVQFDRDNIVPSDLKWREKDEVKKEKFVSSDSSVETGKLYYIPVGKNNFVEYIGGEEIKPDNMGLFIETRALSSDTEANSSKIYYASLTDTNPISTNSIDLTKVEWYVDDTSATRILSQDQTYDRNKTYYPTIDSTSSISVSAPFSPNKLEWFEDKWVLSNDTQIDPNKEYAIRYLTNAKASSAVTTEGLELAKITLSFNNLPNNTPTIFFFPCTYEYAKQHYGEVLKTATNCVFLDDDSYEELYGHQFIITWTVNYHHYLSEEMNGAWHLVFPFDASAKLAIVSEGQAGQAIDTTFASMAESYEDGKFSGFVAYFYNNPSALPNGLETVFGKNAYMVVPHNYIELDEPKQAPQAYALQWDSGTEITSTSVPSKFVTTRVLVTDPYNSTFNYKDISSGTNYHAYTNAYIVPNKQSTAVPTLLEEVRINNAPGQTMSSEEKAIEDIIKVDSSTMITNDDDKYAIGEVKVTDTAVSHDSINGFIDDKGLGYVPAVLPIQLYSNKYVTQKESLHIVPDNTYVVGSSEVGNDSNWTFVKNPDGKTLNRDKFAPLFTAFFNDDVDTSTLDDDSIIKLKPHIENQELKGYDVELIASPEVVKDAVGIRLRFEIHDYREATSEDMAGSPAYGGDYGLGLYEAQMIKKESTDTVAELGKTYYWQVGYKYYEYRIDPNSKYSSKITPKDYEWYVVDEDTKNYVRTNDENVVSDTTYYYLKKDTTDDFVKIDDPYNLSPAQDGLLDETFEDVKWTEDNEPADKKYLYQTNDVLYSMSIDKYLPMAETDTPSYNKDEGAKRLEIVKEADGSSKLHMYFAIAAEELDFDDEYGIGSETGKSFNGKDGIRVYASYLYETDRGGYSYLTNSNSGNLSFSKRADSIINNKIPGTFSIRGHKLTNTNNNYYLDADPSSRQYAAFVDRISGASTIITVPENVYSVNTTEDVPATYKDYKLNRFGSFFSVAEFVDASTSTNDLTIKTTRYQKPGNEISQLLDIKGRVEHDDVYPVYIPSIIDADREPQINVISWKMNAYTDKSAPYGIMQFPKSNLYIAFDNGVTDDGSIVTRQQSKLRYQIYNVDKTNKIYALVTKTPVDVNANREDNPSGTYDTFAFNRTNPNSSTSYTVISQFKDDNSVVQSKIKLEDILRTYVNCSSPSDYFSKMDNEHKVDGAKYSELFIPIYDSSISNLDALTLEALPYNSQYSVSFWVWSLIGESELGSEYGWVSVPYSSLRTNSETIDFSTHGAPQTNIEECFVRYGVGDNKLDGYINKSLVTKLHNGANDLYYVVDLIDNETNELICHLFTAEREDSDQRTFDLDGISGSDGSKPIYDIDDNNGKLSVNGSALKVVVNTDDTPYNSFRYGKLADNKDRYKLVLHTYIMGYGPATLSNPNDYNFSTDEESAYYIYRYIKDAEGKTVKDKTPEHIIKSNVSNTTREFSLNDGFDKLEDVPNGPKGIDPHNGSNIRRSDINNGPYIKFTINKPIYDSYSLAYEKYIPIIIRSRTVNDNKVEFKDITAEVFEDKKYGEANREGGVSAGDGYYIFDFDNIKDINMCADTEEDYSKYDSSIKNKVSDYGFRVKDTVTIFLLSLQDVLDGDQNYLMQYDGEHVTDASLVSQSKIETLLAEKVKALVNDPTAFYPGAKLYPTAAHAQRTTSGPFDMGKDVRVVCGRSLEISSKLVIIKPAHVFGEGTYSDEQLKKLAQIQTLTSKLDSLGTVRRVELAEFEKDCKALEDALKAYDTATSEEERNKWLDEREKTSRSDLSLGGLTDEEIDEMIDRMRNNWINNYDKVVLNNKQLAIDEARIKLGRVEPKLDAAETYFIMSPIPTTEKEDVTTAEPKRTTILYGDDGKPQIQGGKHVLVTELTGGSTHIPGSADRLAEVDSQASEINRQLEAAKLDLANNDKRQLKFSLKIDSESTGLYGTASIQVTLGKVLTPGFTFSNINIEAVKKEDIYGYVNSYNPEELNTEYDTVTVTVIFDETNHNNTQVDVSDATDKCSLSIQEVRYFEDGQESETINGKTYTYKKYRAEGIATTYECTSAVSNLQSSPTVTYVFSKQ